MRTTRRRRPRIGDILEVRTYKGLAYAQYTHWHREYGYLVRVLPGICDVRPTDLAALVQQPGGFFTFLFLNQALRGDIVRIVAHGAVPEHSKAFPLFKAGVKDPTTGRVATW